MTKRKIILVREGACDGCGRCAAGCVDGALRISDGKARLVAERFCDGCGRCLEVCPLRALEIVVREAEEFEEIVMGRC